MNYVDLPDLRHVVRGFKLRVDAARAISHAETSAANGGGGCGCVAGNRDDCVL